MPVRDDLGMRMKTFYEQIPKMRLIISRRTLVTLVVS